MWYIEKVVELHATNKYGYIQDLYALIIMYVNNFSTNFKITFSIYF